jgi:hypothetical protein
VATVLDNIEALYLIQHRYSEAEPLFRRTLAIREKCLGPNHPDLPRTLNGYALLLRETKRKSEAKALSARAQAISAKGPANRSASQTVDVRELDRGKRAWRE